MCVYDFFLPTHKLSTTGNCTYICAIEQWFRQMYYEMKLVSVLVIFCKPKKLYKYFIFYVYKEYSIAETHVSGIHVLSSPMGAVFNYSSSVKESHHQEIIELNGRDHHPRL